MLPSMCTFGLSGFISASPVPSASMPDRAAGFGFALPLLPELPEFEPLPVLSPGFVLVVGFGFGFGLVVGDELVPNGFWSTNWITLSTWYAGASGFASATTIAQWCDLSQNRWFLPNFFPLAGSVYFVSNSPFDCHCFNCTRVPSSSAPAQSLAPGFAIVLPAASSSPQMVAATDPDPLGRWWPFTVTVWLYFKPVAGMTSIEGLAALSAPSAAVP